MFSALSLGSWLKRAVIVALVGLCLAVGYKGYKTVTDHFAHIAEIETANAALTKDNGTLMGNNTTLKASLSEQQSQLETLKVALEKREKDKQEYEQKQAQLEDNLRKLREDNKNEIEAINRAIYLAGISHTPLPDSVVRMLKDKARAINTRSRDSNKSGGTTAPKSPALSTVPGG